MVDVSEREHLKDNFKQKRRINGSQSPLRNSNSTRFVDPNMISYHKQHITTIHSLQCNGNRKCLVKVKYLRKKRNGIHISLEDQRK
jgi:hypothetical protein